MEEQKIICGHKTLGTKCIFEPQFSYQSLLYLVNSDGINLTLGLKMVAKSPSKDLMILPQTFIRKTKWLQY